MLAAISRGGAFGAFLEATSSTFVSSLAVVFAESDEEVRKLGCSLEPFGDSLIPGADAKGCSAATGLVSSGCGSALRTPEPFGGSLAPGAGAELFSASTRLVG